MDIDLRVIGCFRLCVDGVPVDISPVPARLLAYLALQRADVGRPVLAAVLWPTAPHERALGNLRSALWRLPAGTRDAVTETGASLRLARHVHCDLERVLCEPPDLTDLLAWAWRYELLAGWYDDWVLDAREALQVQRAALLEDLAVASSSAGRSGDALMFATLSLAAQPLRESAQRALLRAHLDLGHDREAFALYREFGRMLLRDLGVAPSAETATLMASTPSLQLSGDREEVA
jgi:DNA-binding SARP family transcriptional activator